MTEGPCSVVRHPFYLTMILDGLGAAVYSLSADRHSGEAGESLVVEGVQGDRRDDGWEAGLRTSPAWP